MTKGRRIRKNRRSFGNKFVQLPEYLLNSAAYRDLDCVARALLVEIKRLYNGSNNGRLAMSVRRAAKALGVSKDRANRALNDLQRHGFIRVRQRGSFDHKACLATEWILTEYEYADQLATKDFMSWRPAEKTEHGPSDKDSRSRSEGPKAEITLAKPPFWS